MTIEVVSAPAGFGTREPATNPFHIELFGETRPFIATAFAELIPASAAADAKPVSGTSSPVYEYGWTTVHPGLPRHEGGFLNWLHAASGDQDAQAAAASVTEFWSNLADPAVLVNMFFLRDGG
ncbi:MAG TPA: hypothetical protein VME22_10895 [Solirubrobacteraceae bacterium]|nr:hypothetical protein [Solirubrobacteraceae bacterium]